MSVHLRQGDRERVTTRLAGASSGYEPAPPGRFPPAGPAALLSAATERRRGAALEPAEPPELLRARHHRAVDHHVDAGYALAVRAPPRGRGAQLPHHRVDR